jgi:signal transduction histidine kinase
MFFKFGQATLSFFFQAGFFLCTIKGRVKAFKEAFLFSRFLGNTSGKTLTLVLITEINMTTANFVAETLNQAGFDTRSADNQTEALALYQERRADLVFTNYYLGSGNGIALLKALRRIDPDFLGVMTTGIGNEQVAREAILSGAFDYVIKNGRFYQNLGAMAEDFIKRHREGIVRRKEESEKQRLEAQVELAGWLDHNFKNIMSAAAGSLSLIDFNNSSQTDEKRREYIEDGLSCIKTAMGLLDKLTALSPAASAEANHIVVANVADEAMLNVKRKIEADPDESLILGPIVKRLSFLNNARALSPQRVVREELLTIFETLFKNALESMPPSKEDPTVIIDIGKNGPYLAAEVRDNGRGMDDRVMRHAFEPLFSTKGLVGVGVSLAIVRSLVLKRRGQVSCESEPGKGSVFRFTYFTDEE